ncbi:hypothetical protein VTI74DRAFT_3187 [Chaetomium olivicolor]
MAELAGWEWHCLNTGREDAVKFRNCQLGKFMLSSPGPGNPPNRSVPRALQRETSPGTLAQYLMLLRDSSWTKQPNAGPSLSCRKSSRILPPQEQRQRYRAGTLGGNTDQDRLCSKP